MKNKLFALALAGVTTIGALATGTSVMAEGNTTGQTTVTLSIEPKNTSSYTLTVPSETKLNADGSATALTGGITVSGSDMTKGVKVTAKSKNGFALRASGIDKSIYYYIYSTKEATTGDFAMEFSADDVNNSVNKPVYAIVNNNSLNSAPAGEYEDVITFTAEAVGDSDDSETKNYIQVTADNVDELLGQYATTGTTHEYGNGSSEDAETLATELFNKLSTEGIGSVIVIYKTEDSEFSYWTVYGEDEIGKQNNTMSYDTIKGFPSKSYMFVCVLDNVK